MNTRGFSTLGLLDELMDYIMVMIIGNGNGISRARHEGAQRRSGGVVCPGKVQDFDHSIFTLLFCVINSDVVSDTITTSIFFYT